MDTQERQSLIKSLEARKELLEAEIKMKKVEVDTLHSQIFDALMIKFTWDELRDWLKKNRPENDYRRNPIVSNGSQATYCKLDDEGNLVIGAFGGDYMFPNGCELFVPYDFKSWN